MLWGESSWDVCRDSVCSLICLLRYFSIPSFFLQIILFFFFFFQIILEICG